MSRCQLEVIDFGGYSFLLGQRQYRFCGVEEDINICLIEKGSGMNEKWGSEYDLASSHAKKGLHACMHK